MMETNMYQNQYLICMPMHTLNLIFHFKPIVFNKINNEHHCVGWKRFDIVFELFIFPPHASKLCFKKCCNFGFK